MKDKRQEKELSLREASIRAGISHTHIRAIERGSSTPSFDLVMKLLEVYSVNIAEFLTETGHMTQEIRVSGEIKSVPLLSWTQAGAWRTVASSKEGEYEELLQTDSSGTFALRVRGDSMEPEFFEGDILVINPYLKAEHNDFIVITNEDWEATFKQLKKYGKTRVLHPLNPRYDEIELNRNSEYQVIGVVVEKKKKYR